MLEICTVGILEGAQPPNSSAVGGLRPFQNQKRRRYVVPIIAFFSFAPRWHT